jgi:hypothetical protein
MRSISIIVESEAKFPGPSKGSDGSNYASNKEMGIAGSELHLSGRLENRGDAKKFLCHDRIYSIGFSLFLVSLAAALGRYLNPGTSTS